MLKSENLSIYDRLGGEAAIEITVDLFYDKVLGDPLINRYFKYTDIKKQREYQKRFMTLAFGGPNKNDGKTMKESYKYLRIQIAHFNAIIKHLSDTLTELGVDESTIIEVKNTVEKKRSEIIFIQKRLLSFILNLI